MMIWWYGYMMIWLYDDMYYDDMYYDDMYYDDMMIWWYGYMMICLYDDMVIWCREPTVVGASRPLSRPQDAETLRPLPHYVISNVTNDVNS